MTFLWSRASCGISVKTSRRQQCRLLGQQRVSFRISGFRATARYEVHSVWHELAQKHHLDMLVFFFRLVLHRHAGGSVLIAIGWSSGLSGTLGDALCSHAGNSTRFFISPNWWFIAYLSSFSLVCLYPLLLIVAASAKRSCARFE